MTLPLPFKTVEDTGFKQFVKALNSNYELPDRHTISKENIPAMYKKCLAEMETLASTIENACLITYCWTSRSDESLMAITIHFIDNKFELKYILVGCNLFNTNHTGQNLDKTCTGIMEFV